MHNRVLFVERSGELRLLARLSTIGTEPKGNQVLRGREVSKSRPETGGTGIVIFVALGALAVICSGVFLVTNKRMSKEFF